ncbi:MAG: hypothetical protein IPK26_26695 [Planctomycetes bacterium]|nr:hypothetical protein [Planctomycetota bacterium]
MSARSCLFCIAIPASLAAQVDWASIATTAAPTGRVGHGMAYDSARDRVVLFGGLAGGVRVGDTWLFDGTNWAVGAPTNLPPARAGFPLAYDPGRARVVMFGGIGPAGVLADTWEWDGLDWVQSQPATVPPARRSQPLVFHPARGTTVMWGGFGTGDLNDMWEWNGVDWSAILTTTSPAPRRASDMAWDPIGGGLLLFSGYLQGNDTWYFDGLDWQLLTPPSSPAARYDHSLVTDTLRSRIVLFGGAPTNDTWEWDGLTWTQRSTPTSPLARYDTWLCYDDLRQRVVMFGGTHNGTDTWQYGPTAPGRYAPFGNGCSGGGHATPVLTASERPWIGDAFDVQVQSLPAGSPLTFMVTGFSSTNWGAFALPLNLAVFGMQGCTLFVEIGVSVPIAAASGVATWTLPIPNQTALLGVSFFNQAATFAPGANAAGVIVSNAAAGVVGGR